MSSLLATMADRILRAALSEEYGLVIRVTSADASPALRGRAVLYAYRRDAGQELADLQIRLSPLDPDNELWIINRSGQVEAAETVDIESI